MEMGLKIALTAKILAAMLKNDPGINNIPKFFRTGLYKSPGAPEYKGAGTVPKQPI
jgi:hypothetical protein